MFNYLEFKKAVVKNLQDVLNIEIKRGLAPFKLQELRLEAEKEALKNENRILIESLNNEKQARKDLESIREAEREAKKIELESLNTENLNLKKDIENLRNRRFFGFKISK